MFNFFSKKNVTIENLPDEWSISQVENAEGTLIFRVLNRFDSVTEKKEYPIRIGIAVPIELFDDETKRQLEKLEDEIADMLKRDSLGRLFGVISQLGEKQFREFVAQVKKDTDFEAVYNSLRKKFGKLDVQMTASEDTNWKMYTELQRGRL
jgi:hypothetical protein